MLHEDSLHSKDGVGIVFCVIEVSPAPFVSQHRVSSIQDATSIPHLLRETLNQTTSQLALHAQEAIRKSKVTMLALAM